MNGATGAEFIRFMCASTETEVQSKLYKKYLLLFALVALNGHAQDKFITVASTTSTEQSGLFRHLLPLFEKKTGIQVRVVALGTGQALDMARRGDADVVFVHDKEAEEKFSLRALA